MLANKMIRNWLIVILIPLITIIYFQVFPVKEQLDHLIRGIILACESVFLFKLVLFGVILSHLRQEFNVKKQYYFLFIPVVLLIIYTTYYFLSD